MVSLFTMPAYMRFFADQEVLGVWYTILSLVTWILSFDLGIGNGLRNKLSLALAQDNRDAAKEYISSAYCMIGIASAAVTAIGCALIPHLNWNSVFNISEDLVGGSILGQVVRYAFVGIMLQFFLKLITSIMYAMQKSAVNNAMSLITSVLQLAFAVLAPSLTPVENLRMFSIAHLVCANLPLLIATLVIFSGPLKDCRPSFQTVCRDKALAVVSLGGIFFVCQILYMVIANTNEFFVTQYSNAANVVEYQIYYKMFSLASMLFTLALTPVWSAVSKAIGEKDFAWLRKLFSRFKALGLIGVAIEFAFIPLLQVAINLWLRDKAIQVNYWYALVFAVFGASMLYQSVLSTFVCGMGKMKLQAICYAAGVVAKFFIIDIGMAVTGEWIVVPLSNAIILIPYCVLQQIQVDRYIKEVN